ncbi:GNAT family N-acetyltransferase [Myxococcus sp. CA051A]|uniref:GNAT family N-acetyltransferase n=1 Tax=Myxococcus llanfairpwllgwyngyllgogerychwyrndrobwllllantysiliogogogochensis TaxID=2590453 RepID=A0A540X262_9BACT|nr:MULTISPECIES: GNAT family N-acetyltransferase [Myxococcus]NTX03370.1 GNAT family N-acetyltransferase [Myxococcus sp. CA040A]NTX11780.1 GNAT family N-acetyltransferase [Myxococcus sp. CA056]NTX34119.1 GNAT family N-acetyltransferase [Myxococcus sp. CA033]NTX50929.1 GNAT family N-acetyltransferase [Myxococcus sp. CA039A]NTX65696.1 GNAT family N-acetyltransferase [Myxococcus sp. CA051A]
MSTDELRLRPIQPQDDKHIASIIRAVMPEFGADGPGFALHDAEVDTMSAAYAHPRHAYFVVERAGRILGGGGIAPLEGGDPSVCELRKMYFLPEARGLGVGERMVRRCLDFAREAFFHRCYLETLASMTQAQKLYRRLGFTPLCAPLGRTGHFGCDHWYALDLTKPPG